MRPIIPSNFKYNQLIEKEVRFLNHHMSHRKPEYYDAVRTKLNDLRTKIPRKHDGLVCTFINILKQYQIEAGQQPPESLQNKKHRLSDHAFCMALARMYGIDIMKVKDRILEDIGKYKVRYAEANGVITTVLGA